MIGKLGSLGGGQGLPNCASVFIRDYLVHCWYGFDWDCFEIFGGQTIEPCGDVGSPEVDFVLNQAV